MSAPGAILAIIAALLPVAWDACLAAVSPIDAYTVRGLAVYDTFGRSMHLESTFSLTVSNHCWAIEVLGVQGSEIEQRQVFDGVNLVALRYQDTSKICPAK